ncbi:MULTISPECIES: ABC transporter substrate-binding protein [unclassified Polaromonas]|uniref:ABC transporter substrate-binding protein n=1 Tax=unclassified Polaromonas TaxID=2638319 RepID=UPI0018CBE71B|nr:MULTISPECIES: ABC transporter substrate-binding protein [unclassified Polaromonas]MBG6072660.1 NitT/TauT family transport system substrate-binding protein [Polaromonas sp. CG_9.7]MBG6114621.1 NitT/TauT family transport system substrate-binding protein [Polaromonas sp. CG_9.2]MDH6185216.1 NitT/TauT family transport system substrate-binding protein [Polaromonas sp. CG_23.6]
MERFPRISRRLFTGTSVLAAATLCWPALHAQGQPEIRKITISVDNKAALSSLPLTISEHLGYFRVEGLVVEINNYESGAQAVHALTGKSADICLAGFEHIIHLQAAQQMVQSIVLLGRASQIAFGISTRSLSRYKSIAELKGRKIGVIALKSASTLMASMVLAQGGLSASDVSFLEVGELEGALAALRSGQVDAISHTDPLMTILEQKGEVRIISDARTLKGTAELFGGPMPAACLFAQHDFIRKNPNTCQALANGMVHGLKWLQTAGPGDIIKTVPENYLLGDRGLYIASFNKVRESISLDGILADEAPRTALKAIAGFDASIRASKVDLSKTYTNSFAQRAKERFKA